MGHFAGNARAGLLAAIGISGVAAFGFFAIAGNALAQSPPAANANSDAKKEALQAARKAYDGGLKSYASGKHQASVDQLSTALRIGGFSSAEMAKALYTRGRAYKKLNKPGLAISDLTSALWLKNGLGPDDRQSAMAERAEAYRMAGLGDGNSADVAAVADPNPAPAAAAAPKAAPTAEAPTVPPAAPPPYQTASSTAAPDRVVQAGGVTRQSPDSEKAREAANARRLAAQQVDNYGLQGAAMGSVIGGSPAAATPATTVAPAPAPGPVLSAVPVESQAEPQTAASGTNVGAAIGGFFSNLFSGGSSAQNTSSDVASSVTTASTSPVATTSSWSDSTSVAAGTALPPPRPVTASAKPKIGKGKYKIHIAALRSRADAEALAKQVVATQGPLLKSRVPVVDEAVIGSMGTFYRVRVGSYASVEEPRGVCDALRSSGFDCLVVTK